MKQSFAERAKLVGPLNATTPRADNSVAERQGQLIYLQPGDTFQMDDLYELASEVRVIGRSCPSWSVGTKVPASLIGQPRRYIAA